MEFVTLTEGLVIISNQFVDYSKQSSFIQEVLAPITLRLGALQPHFIGPEQLYEWVGLTKAPTSMQQGDQHAQNRAELTMLVNSLLAVTRRAAAPSDSEQIVRGGFSVATMSGKLTKNPCGAHAVAALPHILLLAQTLNRALSPASAGSLEPGYVKVIEMLVVDRDNILGLPGSRTARNEVTHTAEKLSEPVMRMQNFLTEMFENLQHLLSHFSTNIGAEFYQQQNLGFDLCNTVLSHLPGLPDFRCHRRSFTQQCPISTLSQASRNQQDVHEELHPVLPH